MEQTPSEEPDVHWEARARAYALVSTRLLAFFEKQQPAMLEAQLVRGQSWSVQLALPQCRLGCSAEELLDVALIAAEDVMATPQPSVALSGSVAHWSGFNVPDHVVLTIQWEAESWESVPWPTEVPDSLPETF